MEPIFPMRDLEAALLESDAETLASLRDTVDESARRHAVADSDDSPAKRWHSAHTRVLDAADAVMHGRYLDLLRQPRYGFLFGDAAVEAANAFAASPQFNVVPAPAAAGPKAAHACRFIAFVRAQLHGFIDAGAPTYDAAQARPECHADESGDEASSERFLRAAEALILVIAAQYLYVQVNWTGPSLEAEDAEAVGSLPWAAIVCPSARGGAGEEVEATGGSEAVEGAPALRAVPPLYEVLLEVLSSSGQETWHHADALPLLAVARVALRALTHPEGEEGSVATEGGVTVPPPSAHPAPWWAAEGDDAYLSLVEEGTDEDPEQDPDMARDTQALLKELAEIARVTAASKRATATAAAPAADGTHTAAAGAAADATAAERPRDVLPPSPALAACTRQLPSLPWWAARVAALHTSSIVSDRHSLNLFQEVRDLYARARAHWSADLERGEATAPTPAQRRLAARVLLEWGLAQHVVDRSRGATRTLELARAISGLRVHLTGVSGRRTKFQKFDTAQLVVLAKSAPELLDDADRAAIRKREEEEEEKRAKEARQSGEGAVGPAYTARSREQGAPAEESAPETPEAEAPTEPAASGAAGASGASGAAGEGTDAGAGAAAEGQAAPFMPGEKGAMGLHHVTLDSLDKHQPLLEAPALKEGGVGEEEEGEVSTLDQSVLLGLCANVGSGKPQDGLSAEEMTAYVQRALASPQNWMVYSAGLLTKSLLEFHNSRTMDRGLLQLQAIVDQHTNQLSVTQASLESVESAAPAQDRLRYVHALGYPPRWAMQRMLADKYRKFGALRSAQEIYERLELWEQVMQCLAAMDRRKEAEALARAQLAQRETPELWCALGDLTEDEEHYETALRISSGRCARALRALAVRRFQEDKFGETVSYLQRALAMYAVDPPSWFLLGCAAIRDEQMDVALSAFIRVLQLDPEHAEAWANASAVLAKTNRHREALGAVKQALRIRESSWRMMDNQLTLCLRVQDWPLAIATLHRMLGLRKSQDGVQVDLRIVEFLARKIPALTVDAAAEAAERSQLGAAEAEEVVEDEAPLPTGAVRPVGSGEPGTNAEADSEDEGPGGDPEDPGEDPGDASAVPSYQEQVQAAAARAHASLQRQLDGLVDRLCQELSSEPKMWRIAALLRRGRGQDKEAREAKLKECRAAQRAGWEKDEAAFAPVATAACEYAELCLEGEDAKERYAAKMYLSGIARKAERALGNHAKLAELRSCVARLEGGAGSGAAQ